MEQTVSISPCVSLLIIMVVGFVIRRLWKLRKYRVAQESRRLQIPKVAAAINAEYEHEPTRLSLTALKFLEDPGPYLFRNLCRVWDEMGEIIVVDFLLPTAWFGSLIAVRATEQARESDWLPVFRVVSDEHLDALPILGGWKNVKEFNRIVDGVIVQAPKLERANVAAYLQDRINLLQLLNNQPRGYSIISDGEWVVLVSDSGYHFAATAESYEIGFDIGREILEIMRPTESLMRSKSASNVDAHIESLKELEKRQTDSG